MIPTLQKSLSNGETQKTACDTEKVYKEIDNKLTKYWLSSAETANNRGKKDKEECNSNCTKENIKVQTKVQKL